ncbi:methylated-DNA--[protein]-cysteine S-methyltransferase [Ornithinibacillus xuwenensis]|uniref:Methylated-DNA--protein-cysteine methyltransferase n=1 Tax=Ornithinibacillus xuwenensis TaxID=3144668 RepID=A0ABU9XLP7_9BACI
MSLLYVDEMDSPLGTLLIVSDEDSILRIDFGSYMDNEANITRWSQKYLNHKNFVHNPEKVVHVKKELEEYFQQNRKEFGFQCACYGTAFQKLVWQALIDYIPYGVTRTYKDISVAIGKPNAVRAVGGAVNKNPFSIVVPCHRVVGKNGKLIGYNGGLDKKEYLLRHEEIVL